jgi:hypothetical protein
MEVESQHVAIPIWYLRDATRNDPRDARLNVIGKGSELPRCERVNCTSSNLRRTVLQRLKSRLATALGKLPRARTVGCDLLFSSTRSKHSRTPVNLTSPGFIPYPDPLSPNQNPESVRNLGYLLNIPTNIC